MNTEIKSILNPTGSIWVIHYKRWKHGECRCTAKSGVLEILSDTKPTIKEIEKALNQ